MEDGEESLVGIVDTVKPWTIKAMPNEVRNLAIAAARNENMTVSQWLERLIRERAEGGQNGFSTSPTSSPASSLSVILELARTLRETGAPLQKRVGAQMNALLYERIRIERGVARLLPGAGELG